MREELKAEILKWHYSKGLTPYLIAKQLDLNPIDVKAIIEADVKQDHLSFYLE